MATEIERKFLVRAEQLPQPGASQRMLQGYIEPGRLTMRVRICGDQAFLTLKSPGRGIERLEFEYPIPAEDARQLLDGFALPGRVEKTRHHYTHDGLLWEVDVFEGDNDGLVLAEVELESADQHINLPHWVGREVSGDPRFFNAYLAHTPYRSWPDPPDGPCNSPD